MDILNNAINYPPLSIEQYNKYFQEELVFFYFHSNRFNMQDDFNAFSKRYELLLHTLKTQNNLNPLNTKPFLSLFYKLIANTRDICNGKGEHDVSYLMLFKFYNYFPTLAVFMLHRFVKCINNQQYIYGSWRDIKHLCQIIKVNNNMREDHSFIQIAIEIINSQLFHDINYFKFYPNALENNYVSNVSKWIPRENKKFSWLFDLLAFNWGYTHHPYIMKNANTFDSFRKASNKYKSLYRKKVSFLNKVIDTTEIKLCSKNKQSIQTNKIPFVTISKHNSQVFDYKNNSDVVATFIQNKFHPTFYENTYHKNSNFSHSSLPIYYYVKQAIKLFNKYTYTNNPQCKALNNLWIQLSNLIKHNLNDYILPIIDISNQNDNFFYSAVGYAILISQNSLIQHRILAVGSKPIWITYENTNFIDIVFNIMSKIKDVVSPIPSFDIAFYTLGRTFFNSCNQYFNFKHFVIFSTFTNIDNSFYQRSMDILIQFTQNKPTFSFWNLSTKFSNNLPCNEFEYKVRLFSGFTPLLLQFFNKHSDSPFDFVSKILNYGHYYVLDQYIDNVSNIL